MTEQISMFEALDGEFLLPPERQKLRRALRCGSGFEGGKERIREKSKEFNKKEFAEFLRKEYGIGGQTFENGWIGSSSMHYYICEREWDNRKEYSWTAIAEEILDMLMTNSY